MWAADDDLRDEKFISSCVNELGLNKQAVLCLPHTKVFIEGNKEALYVATLDSFTNKTNLIDRYKETIKSSPVLVIYGVFRSSAINKTKIMQDGIIAADLCFIREISLYGEFIQIPEVLFSYYGRENWNSKEQDYHVFLGDKPKPFFHLPFIGVFTTNCNDVLNSSIPLYIKIRLIIIIFRLELIRLGKRFFVRVLNVVLIKRWKNIIGSYVYNKWFSNINYKIINNKLYHSRVVMTQLGWKER